jgi:hypothetical protein
METADARDLIRQEIPMRDPRRDRPPGWSDEARDDERTLSHSGCKPRCDKTRSPINMWESLAKIATETPPERTLTAH